MDNQIKSKWDLLLQFRRDIHGMIGDTELIGGRISHNSNHEKIFHFITEKSTFTYYEGAEELERKLEIC